MGWVSNIFGIADKAATIISETVEDVDKKNALIAELGKLKEQVYMAELSTSTIAWVDAVHKMGRQIISLVTIVGGFVLLAYDPSIDPMKLAAIAAPGGVYNWIKGKGQ